MVPTTSSRNQPELSGKVHRVLISAENFHGTSLNKYLLTGPDLVQNLIYVLLRFRQIQFAMSRDIEGLFLQVGVPDHDQPSLSFFVRHEDPTTNVAVYQYTRDILQLTTRYNIGRYPEATKAVPETFYMEDWWSCISGVVRFGGALWEGSQ